MFNEIRKSKNLGTGGFGQTYVCTTPKKDSLYTFMICNPYHAWLGVTRRLLTAGFTEFTLFFNLTFMRKLQEYYPTGDCSTAELLRNILFLSMTTHERMYHIRDMKSKAFSYGISLCTLALACGVLVFILARGQRSAPAIRFGN